MGIHPPPSLNQLKARSGLEGLVEGKMAAKNHEPEMEIPQDFRLVAAFIKTLFSDKD